MDNKNNYQLVIIIALFCLIALGVLNVFKSSSNLKETKKIIENVLDEVKETKNLVDSQKRIIDELNSLNDDLKKKINELEISTQGMKKSVDNNFNSTNKTINEIKSTVDRIKKIEII